MNALLDTSILVALASQDEAVPDLSDFSDCAVSSLSWVELLVGAHRAQTLRVYKERARRLDTLRKTFGEGIAFDDHCLEALGIIHDRIETKGGSHEARTSDRMIAATAMAHSLVLVSRDRGDLAMLAGLCDVIQR